MGKWNFKHNVLFGRLRLWTIFISLSVESNCYNTCTRQTDKIELEDKMNFGWIHRQDIRCLRRYVLLILQTDCRRDSEKLLYSELISTKVSKKKSESGLRNEIRKARLDFPFCFVTYWSCTTVCWFTLLRTIHHACVMHFTFCSTSQSCLFSYVPWSIAMVSSFGDPNKPQSFDSCMIECCSCVTSSGRCTRCSPTTRGS